MKKEVERKILAAFSNYFDSATYLESSSRFLYTRNVSEQRRPLTYYQF